MLRDSWPTQKFSFKVFFEAHRLQKLRDSSLYLEGAFVDTKNVTLPLQHQKLHLKGTHEVSCHFNTVWPNFTPPATEQELLVATVSKISNLRSEPMDGLKIPPKGSTSNFKSNRHRLTIHQLSKGEIKPIRGKNHRCRHSSNKANG